MAVDVVGQRSFNRVCTFLSLFGVCSMFVSFPSFGGAVGTDIRRECINDEIALRNPHLADVIRQNAYEELTWTARDPQQRAQYEQKLSYCNKDFKCYKYNITGDYQQRIETTTVAQGVLYIKQKKFNDKLTYTCRVIQKGNKAPRDYAITVTSSANCLSSTVGESIDLSRVIHGKFSKKGVEDITWYRILQGGRKEKIVHCSPSRASCVLISCVRSCPEYLTRLKTDGLSVILTNVTPNDRGLEFQCELYPGIHGPHRAYSIKIREVAEPQEGTTIRTPEEITGGSLQDDASKGTKQPPTIPDNVAPENLKVTRTLLFLCLISKIFTFPG
ncbi:uncharacterized protein LOC111326324 isoform X1 [Stylophora pistillata]|uniref:uncharacterized protein LOC111326324 isoform X1 n=1 Tax=Stylophora pistillata TaxID=50429 RepID=UPI000C056B73|nr:uncharacterized protein LOC111326324 isoform X1 [Stylophora pistillata]